MALSWITVWRIMQAMEAQQHKTVSEKLLKNMFPKRRVECPTSASEIRLDNGVYVAYVLAIDGYAIVVGHGRRNRAKVIFDSLEKITSGHIKAIIVRLHALFPAKDAKFERFTIYCTDKMEAKKVEAQLHREIGGNSLDLP